MQIIYYYIYPCGSSKANIRKYRNTNKTKIIALKLLCGKFCQTCTLFYILHSIKIQI